MKPFYSILDSEAHLMISSVIEELCRQTTFVFSSAGICFSIIKRQLKNQDMTNIRRNKLQVQDIIGERYLREQDNICKKEQLIIFTGIFFKRKQP